MFRGFYIQFSCLSQNELIGPVHSEGSALYLYGLSLSKVSIMQTRFEGNMGTHGTICISTAVVDFIGNTTFTTNSARGNGGAICKEYKGGGSDYKRVHF